MKYSEAKKEIEALSSKYSAYKDTYTNFFNVYYKNGEVAYVRTNERYSVTVWFEKYFPKLPFSNKLYMILAELAMTPLDERVEEKKYYVKIFDGGFGYLNIHIPNGDMTADNVRETSLVKTKFTDKAIEQLKKRDDIPLDWNKVKFEKADDQMNDEQEKLLESILDALQSQPDKPFYEDYEQGNISRNQYYKQLYQFKLVEEIVEFLEYGVKQRRTKTWPRSPLRRA